ncbi:MAG: hypothetical protein JXB49_05500, partial [Bacteroidales bacterium]|nr:hypothetical protein [Bacteroidales bacterium]
MAGNITLAICPVDEVHSFMLSGYLKIPNSTNISKRTARQLGILRISKRSYSFISLFYLGDHIYLHCEENKRVL